ncbi:MAG: hypothetical protein K2X64_05535 [Rhodocyclaceae bacterium]|nr:hypothetical protein [Rhodocyclaceae bacterium]
MSYYDPWSHAIKIFFTRLLQFILLSVILGSLVWYALLRWYFGISFIETSQEAILGDSIALRTIFALCICNGALLTGWLFTWLTMRWPSRNRGDDRHNRGARVIDPEDE